MAVPFTEILTLRRHAPIGCRLIFWGIAHCGVFEPAVIIFFAFLQARSSRLRPPVRRNSRQRWDSGNVKVGLLLPLSASGNAGVAAQSMRTRPSWRSPNSQNRTSSFW